MATKKEELFSKLESLGFTEDQLAGKTNSELEGLVSEKEAEMATLRKQSQEAENKMKEPVPADKPAQKMYSGDEVRAMFAEFKKEMAKPDAEELDEDGPRKHTVRMARLLGKFVIGMKNLNEDPFFPNRVNYSKDVFNQETKQFVPHTTFILKAEKEGEANEEVSIPIETAFKVSNKVDCELVERKQKDSSVKYGQIEVKELGPDQWNMKSTGNFIQGKQKKFTETYVVKLPNGELVEVIPDVVNW